MPSRKQITPSSLRAAGKNSCPVCDREPHARLVPLSSLPHEIALLAAANAPGGRAVSFICPRCAQLFERAHDQLERYAAVFEQGRHVLPTWLRFGVDERITGRGVTVAFIDSGFCIHPDLTTPRSRILAYHDVIDGSSLPPDVVTPASCHGLMTAVVAAGNGALSGGFFRGLAPDADVVLVRAGLPPLPEASIRLGLEWILEHREEYRIRVINISVGGSEEQSYLHSPLSLTVERAIGEGLVVVCEVGDAGPEQGHSVSPPASAPSCITVGGLDELYSPDRARRDALRSSYGPTLDGFQKPEIIVPGIWVPAPILPHTPAAAAAKLYATLYRAPDDELRPIIEGQKEIVDSHLYEARGLPAHLLRNLINVKLREANIISDHYTFVAGTLFAAPVVSSTVACMLQAQPSMTPQQVKRILIATAERLPDVEIDRQGWGVIDPRQAIDFAFWQSHDALG